MKMCIGILRIFMLSLVLMSWLTSCNKDTDPVNPVINHPIVGQWIFSSSKYAFPGYTSSTGQVADSRFADTASINFIDATTYVYTWPYMIVYSQPPAASWAKVSGTYSISQDSILNILPKKNGTVNNANTNFVSVNTNALYKFLTMPFPYVTDTSNFISSFKLINNDRLVIVTYYPQGATASTFVGYDSAFFNRKK